MRKKPGTRVGREGVVIVIVNVGCRERRGLLLAAGQNGLGYGWHVRDDVRPGTSVDLRRLVADGQPGLALRGAPEVLRDGGESGESRARPEGYVREDQHGPANGNRLLRLQAPIRRRRAQGRGGARLQDLGPARLCPDRVHDRTDAHPQRHQGNHLQVIDRRDLELSMASPTIHIT
jgi:hypothetical protein